MMKISTKFLALAMSAAVTFTASAALESSFSQFKAHPGTRTASEASAVKNMLKTVDVTKQHISAKKTTDSSAPLKAQAKVEDTFGEWETGITGTYTYVQLFQTPVALPVTLEKRVSTTNPGHIQYKITDFLKQITSPTGIEVIYDLVYDEEYEVYDVTIPTVATGKQVGVSQTNPNLTTELYYDDAYTFLSGLVANGANISENVVNSWKGSSTYNDVTGRFTIQARYHGPFGSQYQTSYMGEDAEYLQLDGDYKNYDLELTGGDFYKKNGIGYFNFNINLNDVPLVLAGVKQGKIATQEDLMAAIEALASGDFGEVIEKSGDVNLVVNPYENGDYMFVYVAVNDKGMLIDADFSNFELTTAEFERLGTGKLTDAFIVEFLKNNASAIMAKLSPSVVLDINAYNFPAEYTSDCIVSESDLTPGLYRITGAYEKLFMDYIYPVEREKEAGFDISYYPEADAIVVDASIPDKAVVDLSPSGIALWCDNINSYMNVFIAGDPVLNKDPFDDSYCVLADNAITCPTDVDGDWGPLYTVFPEYSVVQGQPSLTNMIVNIVSNPKSFKIELPKADESGIGSVIADEDANAPVEFFNLQGVKVENPENGLYIRRQGKNVSKVIIRN